MNTEMQDAVTILRDCYITIDRSKDIKDLDAELPNFLDNFAKNSVLAAVFHLSKQDLKQRVIRLEILEQPALSEIRALYATIKKACIKRGIVFPAYRDDFPPEETIKDHAEYPKIKRLMTKNTFQAYEEGLIQSSDPLIVSLFMSLQEMLNLIQTKDVELHKKLNIDLPSYMAWNHEYRQLQDPAWNSFVWLMDHNPYGTVLMREVPTAAQPRDALNALFSIVMSTPPFTHIQYLTEKKLHVKKVYDYALQQITSPTFIIDHATPIASTSSSANLPHNNPQVVKKQPTPSTSTISIYASPDPDDTNKILMVTDGKEDHHFYRYDPTKDNQQETLQVKLLLLLWQTPNIARRELLKIFSKKQLYGLRRTINGALKKKWRLKEEYITWSNSGIPKINDNYPTKYSS